MGRVCCPGVSLCSTPRLNLKVSLREKSCQFSDFSCRRVAVGGVAKLWLCHQCRDIALRCGLVTKELCKRTKGTSLHLGSSATPSIHDGCGRASTRPYIGLCLVLWCKPKSCALRLILMIPLCFLALCPSVSLLALLANLVRLANGKFFTNILVI